MICESFDGFEQDDADVFVLRFTQDDGNDLNVYIDNHNAVALYQAVRKELDGYIREMEQAKSEWRWRRAFRVQEDVGYDLDDPKHPTYVERVVDGADLARKREKGE
jgi:hypothetical protein